MSRKVTGIVVAVVLALVGTVALVAYVGNAENRALAGEQLAPVYVVTSQVPAGTASEDLGHFVSLEKVPAKVRAAGAVEDLGSLQGKVTAVDLVVGEQVIASRLVSRTELANRQAGVKVPDAMVEITVKLDPARAVGGLIQPGQTVAVFSSFEPFQLTAPVVKVNGQDVAVPQAVAAEISGSTPNTTDVILHKVLVTAVQQGPQQASLVSSGGGDKADRLNTAPTESLLVTLAVHPFDAERVVFTAEFGRLWLGAERDTVSSAKDPVQSRGSVYNDQVNP
jgi:pilus assembly protein CpaB